MSMLTNYGGKKNHIKKENCSIPLRPPPCHKIWMSRKVICVCWEMKCSTGLKTYCICLEICFPGRKSGVSEREAAACVSSKRERADTLIISWSTMCSSTCSNLHSQAPLWRQTDVPSTRCKVPRGETKVSRREAEEWKYSAEYTIRV